MSDITHLVFEEHQHSRLSTHNEFVALASETVLFT